MTQCMGTLECAALQALLESVPGNPGTPCEQEGAALCGVGCTVYSVPLDAGCVVELECGEAEPLHTVQCDGELAGVLTLPCHRCLGPAKVPLAVPVHTIFVPPAKIPVEDTTADPEADDLDFAHHDGEIVDLAPIMREYIILAVPLRILCKDDCLGLCPQCGTDRNAAACSCLPPPSIGPLAALKNLKL